MRNLTITVEEDVARWARITAAERDTSVSRLVGEILRERMSEEREYEEAMQTALARAPVRLKKGGRYPTRQEIHERSILRGHEPPRVPTRRERAR